MTTSEKGKQLGMYLLERYGLPMCLLLAVLWFVGMHIVDPLLQSHIGFLNVTAESVKTITDVEKSQVTALEQMNRLIQDQGRCLEDLHRAMRRPGVDGVQSSTTIGRTPGG